MKRIIVVVIGLLICNSVYCQFEASDISIGGSFEASVYADRNDYLLFEPLVAFNLSPRLSMGACTKIAMLFMQTEDDGYLFDSFLKYQIINQRYGIAGLGGAQWKSNFNVYASNNPNNLTPFVGLSFNYFISSHVILECQIKDYFYYNREEALRNDQTIGIYLLYNF